MTEPVWPLEACLAAGASLACVECERAFHSLCIQPPALKPNDLPEGIWTCVSCGFSNRVGVHCHEAERELTCEKMGLTPDWIIQAKSPNPVSVTADRKTEHNLCYQ